jgi:hypothetical protein
MTNQSVWSEVEQTLVQRERWPGRYDAKYTPLVYPGQKVLPDQPVLRVQYAQPVEYAGMPVPATETLPAGLSGRVLSITRRGGVVIEGRVTLVRGALGVGRQVAGVLTLWSAEGSRRTTPTFLPGAILIVPGPIDFTFLQRALASGISAIVASSITVHDLEGFLRTDMIQLLDFNTIDMAQTYLPPITLFLTEGLGTFVMPPRLLNLLSRYQGTVALLSGVTSVRRSVFPELLISLG